MSGLILKLTAGERFVINGAVLENGDKPARIRITEDNVRVLRCRDALRPEEVDTPVKQVYFAIQLLITGDLDETVALPAIDAECCKLQNVFMTIQADLIPTLREMRPSTNCGKFWCSKPNCSRVRCNLQLLPQKPGWPEQCFSRRFPCQDTVDGNSSNLPMHGR
ncbi:MAG: flagellar biosynthesis repressor FlbT [Henriciella sp.]|nr:flagellar biosynthesis repressor FlbT [Henriciella sp.]